MNGTYSPNGTRWILSYRPNALSIAGEQHGRVVIVPACVPPAESMPMPPTTSGACSCALCRRSPAETADRPGRRARAPRATPPGRDGWDTAGRRSRRRRAGLRNAGDVALALLARQLRELGDVSSHSPGPDQLLSAATSRLGWTRTACCASVAELRQRHHIHSSAARMPSAMQQGPRQCDQFSAPRRSAISPRTAKQAFAATSRKLIP